VASRLTAGVTIFLRPGRAASLSSIASARSFLQPGVLLLQRLQPAGVRHLHATVLRLPLIEGRFADPGLAAHIGGLRPRLLLPQYRDDLLLGGPRSFHRPSPFGGRTLPKSGGVLRAQVISYEVVKYVARSGDRYTPAARGGGKGGGNGRRTVATACAATPSPRPVNPSLSVVVALMLTRLGAMPRIAATRSIIAAR
jgi:hypothetical protein